MGARISQAGGGDSRHAPVELRQRRQQRQHCRQCGGRMTLAPAQDRPNLSDAFRAVVAEHRLSSLLESAQSHQRSDHGAER